MKRIKWMPLPDWMALTMEQHRRLDEYLKEQNAELGIDLIGDHCRSSDDAQRDWDEYIEEVSLGGRPFKVRR